MTVGDLINELNRYDPNTLIYNVEYEIEKSDAEKEKISSSLKKFVDGLPFVNEVK